MGTDTKRGSKLTLAAGLSIATGLAVYPPWHWTVRTYNKSCGYSFIGDAPNFNDSGCSIDLPRLLVEWAAVAAVTTIGVMLARGPVPLGDAPVSELPEDRKQGADWRNSAVQAPAIEPVAPKPPEPLPTASKSEGLPAISSPPLAGLSDADKWKVWNMALRLTEMNRRELARRRAAAQTPT